MQWQQVARRQAGVLTRAQAHDLGLSARQIERLLSLGHLRCTDHRGVLAAGAVPFTAEQAYWQAVLATSGTLSHHSAAAAWDIDLPVALPAREAVHVTVAHSARPRNVHGLLVHRIGLRPRDRTLRHGLPITTRSRTVLDCLGVLPLPAARTLLDRSLQRRLVTPQDLERRLRDEPARVGNAVIAVLRRELSGAAAESERVLHRLLGAAGLAGWQPNLAVRVAGERYEIDVAFAGALLAVEVDGWAYHWQVDRFRADRRKQNALSLAGWQVLRFAWADLMERPDYVLATIATALAQRGHLAPL